MKLLIIEDSHRLAERIKNYLDKRFVVDVVHTGEEGLERATNINYGVILLDLGLPDTPGLDVCRQIRAAGVHTPILVLTGVDTIDSRVQLLDAGADDYVTKPFKGPELIARIKALGRRRAYSYTRDVLVLRDLEIDTNRRVVRRSGVTIPLRRKEFDVLEYLVHNRGRAVTREMILNHAWEADKDSWNNTVDVHIKHLRDKIDRPFRTPLIKTAYGIGYMVDDTGK